MFNSNFNISFERIQFIKTTKISKIKTVMKTFEKLNFPESSLKIKYDNLKPFVFDSIRKKWLVLTPEEWVRQHLINYLIIHKNYPASLISLEAGLKYNTLSKRTDVLVYNKSGKPFLIIECKAPKISIDQKVIEQIGVYNKTKDATYLCVTNGLKHYCWSYNEIENKFIFLQEIPDFKEISS